MLAERGRPSLRSVLRGGLGSWIARDGEDEGVRAANLAAGLFGLAALAIFATAPVFHDDHLVAVLLTAGLALATGAALPLLPWHRWPRRVTLLPVLWAFLLMGVGLGFFGAALSHYLPFYGLSFLYIGLTQPPGTSLKMFPVAAGTGVLWRLGPAHQVSPLDWVVAVGVAVALGETLARSVARQQRSEASVSALLGAVGGVADAGSVEEGAGLLARFACELLGADAAVVLLIDPARTDVATNYGSYGVPVATGSLAVTVAGDQTGIGIALRSGKALFVPTALTSPLVPEKADRWGARSVAFVPVLGQETCFGVITAWWHRALRAPAPAGEQALAVLSRHAGSVLERLQAAEHLATVVQSDPLTGLGNRRVLDVALEELPVGGSVVFLDLDHFKAHNDAHGHAAGDRALVAFAALLATSLRAAGDRAIRFGGEEFIAVLPGAGVTAAEGMVNRLRASWAAQRRPVTFSAGIAERAPGGTARQALAHADECLYAAKSAGRNCTVAYPRAHLGTARAGRAEPASQSFDGSAARSTFLGEPLASA